MLQRQLRWSYSFPSYPIFDEAEKGGELNPEAGCLPEMQNSAEACDFESINVDQRETDRRDCSALEAIHANDVSM